MTLRANPLNMLASPMLKLSCRSRIAFRKNLFGRMAQSSRAFECAAGLGSWSVQITYRQRWSPQWAFFTQLSTSRLLEPSQAVSSSPSWGGQLGLIYFSH
jgi:hypothetical protein